MLHPQLIILNLNLIIYIIKHDKYQLGFIAHVHIIIKIITICRHWEYLLVVFIGFVKDIIISKGIHSGSFEGCLFWPLSQHILTHHY